MLKTKTIYSPEHQRLTAWLVAKKKDQGISIRQLAVLLGWSPSIVGKVFSGDRRLDVVEYAELCQVLGADACEGLKFQNG